VNNQIDTSVEMENEIHLTVESSVDMLHIEDLEEDESMTKLCKIKTKEPKPIGLKTSQQNNRNSGIYENKKENIINPAFST
jgi:hypothetical protein